jgi:hypothetical protein
MAICVGLPDHADPAVYGAGFHMPFRVSFHHPGQCKRFWEALSATHRPLTERTRRNGIGNVTASRRGQA